MQSWERYLKASGWSSEYPSVDMLLRHYVRKMHSELTRRNSLFALSAFCRFAGKSPEELVSLASGEAGALLQGFLDAKHGAGRSIRYINVLLAYLEVFFRVNGFKNGREIAVERYHQPVRYRKRPEYIPTPDEVYRMAYAAGSRRNTALILLAYTSGLRNATVRSLRYRDVGDELERGCEVVKVPVYPEMKEVDPGACKGGIAYYTFISGETVKALREYLGERGRVEDDGPLFCSETTNIPSEVRRRIWIKGDTIEAVVKRAAERGGVKDWRHVTPHCLRKAFESALRNSGIDVDHREFLMGHVLPGSKDTYYDRSKVEELRSQYTKVQFFKTGALDRVEMMKTFAKSLGFRDIELKVAKLRETEPEIGEEEAVGKIVRADLLKQLQVEARKKKRSDDPKKIVSEEELEGYLAEGWDMRAVLPSGKIIIEK